jgi:hypothetical protein
VGAGEVEAVEGNGDGDVPRLVPVLLTLRLLLPRTGVDAGDDAGGERGFACFVNKGG